ncbi:mannose-6-phosphate isomerase [Tetranychus urticae]|nr:mannose-6-phosphate isomerase [Tetranychus urticae]
MISLKCPVKNYDWGKIGSNSFVGQILIDQGIPIDENLPYAELWMGTHKSGSSCIRDLGPDLDNRPLADLFSVFPEFIGNMDIYKKYGHQLPFLFKVLSVNKPLSIQVHPDKSLAGQLFKTRPEHYPDSNHKPEMAIALTPFTGLAYFRPHDEIINFAKRYQQLGDLIGIDLLAEYESANENDRAECLKKCFVKLLKEPQEIIADKIKSLLEMAANDNGDNDLKIFSEIASEYPGDVGSFAYFFLNHVKLEPGQALFIDVNQPHCYLSGDCVEIMACSDNVIRAGLTPKYKDVDLLCETMTYKPKSIDEIILKPTLKDPFTCLYSPSVDEFAIEKIEIDGNQSKTLEYRFEGLHSASLLIIIECGSARINPTVKLKKSNIYFIPPGLNYVVTEIEGKFLAFRAFIRQ